MGMGKQLRKCNFDVSVGELLQGCCPSRSIPFVAPTAMSRYEGVRQCGTSATVRPDGRLMINFNKNTNPMVLHFSGLAFNLAREERCIEIIQPDTETKQARLHAMPENPPALQVQGGRGLWLLFQC